MIVLLRGRLPPFFEGYFMRCTNPITLVDGQLDFPCGKCMSCRIQRTQEWTIRLIHEGMYHDDSLFITLSYNDNSLPDDGSLDPVELCNFWKRFRKELGRKIRYYSVGEYGDNMSKDYYLSMYGRPFGRPHYHAIVYGVNRDDFEPHSLRGKYSHKSWQQGFIDVDDFNYNTGSYVCGYIQKKLFGKKAEEVYGGLVPPFSRMSKGLGVAWALDHAVQLREQGFINFRGMRLSIPRYYFKILGLDSGDYDSNVLDEKYQELLRRFDRQKREEDDIYDFNIRTKVQRRKNIEASRRT